MKKLYIGISLVIIASIIGFTILGQLQFGNNQKQPPEFIIPSRESSIPNDAIKMTPQADANPPKSHSIEFYDPVPIQGKVNSAGAEDSAFIISNGSALHFFFVPDVRVPVQEQVLEPTVGIYVSRKTNGVWTEPERILLQDEGKLAMDGCEFVQGNIMYFCSAREGYTGLHWFRADYIDGKWRNWENADQFFKTSEYEVGELHISSDGQELYFHSKRAGGVGGLDIWVSKRINGEWSIPVNVAAVNSPGDEGWPALSPDGNELWFSKEYGVWRSKKLNGGWQAPEKMFSPLAGEPSIDAEGNVYFTHHFFENDVMIEADIYVAFRK